MIGPARATTRKTLMGRSATAVPNCGERTWRRIVTGSSMSTWLLCAIGSAFLVLSIVYIQSMSSSSSSFQFQHVIIKSSSEEDSTNKEIMMELIQWERAKELEEALTNVTLSKRLHDKTSPQGKAFDWLVLQDGLELAASSSHLIQRYVLAVLYYATTGHQWHYANNVWLSDKHECKWSQDFGASGSSKKGVFQCDSDNRVRHLQLADNNLVGSIPPELGYLTWLESLDLESNRLVGSIPTELGLLEHLEYLNLNSNKLEGNIPLSLKNLHRLEQMLLYFNDLTGVVSDDICILVDDVALYNFQTDCLSTSSTTDEEPAIQCECCSYCCDGISHCALPQD